MAQKPKTLNFVEAASAPIVSVTAWQMLFGYARVTAGKPCSFMGPQATSALTPCSWLEARDAGLHVVATAAPTIWTMSGVWVPEELWTITRSDLKSC
jgi:hypothetical protein